MSYSSLLTKSWIDVFCKIITAPIHEVGLRNRQYSSSTNTWASHLDQALDGDRGTLLCRDAGELGFTSWMEESESRRQMEAGGIHVSTPVAQRRHRTPGSQMGTPEPGAEKRSAPWRWEWSLLLLANIHQISTSIPEERKAEPPAWELLLSWWGAISSSRFKHPL